MHLAPAIPPAIRRPARDDGRVWVAQPCDRCGAAVGLDAVTLTPTGAVHAYACPPAAAILARAGHPGYGEAFAAAVLERIRWSGETVPQAIDAEMFRATVDSDDRSRERAYRQRPCCAPGMCPECWDRGGHTSSIAPR